MRKARCSALPVLQFCGQSQLLGETLGGNRSAEIGSAFHALCSGEEGHKERLARLTESELEELNKLYKPTPIVIDTEGGTVELSYANAVKEFPIGMLEDGRFCKYDDENALLNGTNDMHWPVEIDGQKVVYVADIKRSSYAAMDGHRSLQVRAYALALVSYYNADGFVTGIWDATEGEYDWSDYVDAWGEEAEAILETVVAAAKNHGGEYNLGSHCLQCYSRPRCKQWLLPPELAESKLEPFTKPDGLNKGNALEAYLLAKRAQETADATMAILKNWAIENGGIPSEDGKKVYKQHTCKGRIGFNSKQFEKDHPELYRQYATTGAPYLSFGWKNNK